MHVLKVPLVIAALGLWALPSGAGEGDRPNIVLVMADDQGWGQTGYYNHPLLRTPNLDAMAANGLRFDRFYAGGPVCSPTRASLLTGRTHDRTGVYSHGYALRLEEKTLAQALQQAGYGTGHFGKWHLNGLRGPGVPLLASDTHHPGHFGFDEWLAMSNYFDRDPLMSRMGRWEEFQGDSSEIIVAEALKFIGRMKEAGRPSLSVIWFGSPHSPWIATQEDQEAFAKLDSKGRQHHGELVAMDRSIGTLRDGLRRLGIAENTLVWFNSDNGGLPGVGADSVGGLRGKKGQVWEGGLRVPGIVEWPGEIKPRITEFPAAVMDIFPTLAELLKLPDDCMLEPIDGTSLVPLFQGEVDRRESPIPFQFQRWTVLLDNSDKIVFDRNTGTYELYDLATDPKETMNVIGDRPEVSSRLKAQVNALAESIARSDDGVDYPGAKIKHDVPERMLWAESPAYSPYLEELFKRSEYKGQKGKVRSPRKGPKEDGP
jgi:arylsulfatase A-like enzyme